ncbi:MAG: rhomboid family intramembrane serine protease [Gammaproteobacteria bacterium]|nr:rhomboid family intramembrane serine protease [Gammaproteobacteria bacterium]
MLFFPYRADLSAFKFPFITILLCAACLGVTCTQQYLDGTGEEAAAEYCKRPGPELYQLLAKHLFGKADAEACQQLMGHITLAQDPREFVAQHIVGKMTLKEYPPARGRELLITSVLDHYRGFAASVPASLTPKVWYEPSTFDPIRAIIATFAHSSWQHVIGNIFFFFAFAAAIEALLGPVRYLAVFVAMSVGAFMVYSLTGFINGPQPPTLGLSGAVFGMMGLFAWFAPSGHVSCLFWFLLLVRKLIVPAWLLFLWYVAADLLRLLFIDDGPGVNVVAHLAGGAIGYGLGALFLRRQALTAPP